MSAEELKAIECKQFTTTINNDAYLPCGCLIWDKKEFFETTYILIVKYMQKETYISNVFLVILTGRSVFHTTHSNLH